MLEVGKVAESGVLSSEKVSLMGVRRELDDEDTERVGEGSDDESAGVERGSTMRGGGMGCGNDEVPVMLCS
jgi:hypothetical protein